EFNGGWPIDRAVVEREVFVLLPSVIVEVDGGNKIAKWRETLFEALGFRKIGKVRVADIEIEAQAGEASFVDKIAEVAGIAHFAAGVLNADGDAHVVRVQDEMLE